MNENTEKWTVTVVPADFFEALIRELDEPAEPNERLADAARRRAEVIKGC